MFQTLCKDLEEKGVQGAAFLVGRGLTTTKPGMEAAPQNADLPGELGRYKEADTFQSKGAYNKTPVG